MPGDRIAATLGCSFEVRDGFHDFRIAHVARGVIVLVNGQDSGVPGVCLVKLQEITRVLREEGEVILSREGEMDRIVLTVEMDTCVGRSDHTMSGLLEEARQQTGIRAVIQIQVEGHEQPLPA